VRTHRTRESTRNSGAHYDYYGSVPICTEPLSIREVKVSRQAKNGSEAMEARFSWAATVSAGTPVLKAVAAKHQCKKPKGSVVRLLSADPIG